MEEKFTHSTLTFALQALLARHETYMADAERDRLDLTARIERLELDKQELETENANKIEENRQLLDQLEMLNSTVTESDTKIRSLEASLLSSQQAVRRLEAAAARAEDAERHLAAMEEEQLQLHSELRVTREDARNHAQRCKAAQRGILDMQDQLERMEKEAREERERHAEVIGRMERQREVEKQLDTAAGRLKGAAMTKSLGLKKDGSSVVNHFVRDLLQDNANLQLGIAELREMLMNSNDEIQSLREQLMYHQPITQEDDGTQSRLHTELGSPHESGMRVSQELHIHHHYHVAKQEVRKPKKKRQGLTPAVFGAPISSATTAPAQSGIMSSPSMPANPSQPGRIHQTPNSSTSYSNAPSDFAASAPSSPRSNRVSSLFDSSAFDNGPPTSPTTSFDPMSPTWRAHHKRPSAASFQSFQSFQNIPQLDVPDTPQHGQRNYFDNTIQEVDEESQQGDGEAPSLNQAASTEESTAEDSEFSKDESIPQPRLRRALSHESIMSLTGGLDIHTLKSRPSQMTLRPIGGLEAVVTGVTAQPTLSRSSGKRSDVALRDHFAGYQSLRSVSGPSGSDTSRASSPARPNNRTGALGKLVGWRPWAGSNNNAVTDVSEEPPKPTPSPRKPKTVDLNRPPGINQSGAIPGFPQYWASQRRKGAPAKVHADAINYQALSEGLEE
jgi:myosin heavy subunit